METLWYYGVLAEINKQKIISDIDKFQPKRVVLFGETEWELYGLNMEIVLKCRDKNIKLVIVHGCFQSDWHAEYYSKFPADLDIEIIFWGTYWFSFSAWCIGNTYRGYENQTFQTNFKYPFLNMNCRSHVHRCALIDELARRDLISKGKVSWHDHLQENQDFKFKYFDRKNKLRLGDDFEHKLDSFLLPDCYHDTFMVLATESTTKANFTTEKTVIPILFKKPFLVLAGRGYNKNLFDMGFVPYDEIFDYSFDQVEDLYDRTSMAVENVDRIINMDWSELYNKIKHKLDYNQKLAFDISKNYSLIPDIVKEKFVDNIRGISKKSVIENTWRCFLDRCDIL